MAEIEDIIKEKAAWARTFRDATTNAAQRARYADEIKAADELRSREDAASFERTLTRDKGARDLFLGRERLRAAAARAEQAQENFLTTQERLMDAQTFNQEMALRRDRLNALNEQRRMAKEIRDADNAERILDHTLRAEEFVDNLSKGSDLGTVPFAQGVLEALIRFPMMDPKARASFIASAGIKGDPEQISAQLKRLPLDQQQRATVVYDDDGGGRITVGPVKTAKPTEDPRPELTKRLTDLIKMDLKDAEEEDRMFIESQKRMLRKALADASAPAETAPKASETPPSKSPSGTTEKWVRGPDGKPMRAQ